MLRIDSSLTFSCLKRSAPKIAPEADAPQVRLRRTIHFSESPLDPVFRTRQDFLLYVPAQQREIIRIARDPNE
jgi:hypothetical protein